MRSARLAGYLFGGAAALGAAVYLVIYLYRWQWQRTIICGVLLLVIEVLLLGLAALERISRLEQRLRDSDSGRPPDEVWERHEEILALLRQADQDARPVPGRPRFAWLDGDDRRTFVFVPVLMAAGVALSGLAWVVERIARGTIRPAANRHLAGRLAPLAAPPGGLRAAVPDLPPQPPLGSGPPRERLVRAAALAVAAAGVVGLFLGLAALTETKPPERGDETATSLLFTIDSRGISEARASLAAQQLWERCRDATAIPLIQAGMTALDQGLFAATIHPSLSDHDEHRLRGCLEDASVDRVQVSVVGTGSIGST